MDKLAFIPLLPFKIKDREEYDSSVGKLKREINEITSRASGATTGLLAGAAAGLVAGHVLSKIAPGKLNMPVRVSPSGELLSGYPISETYAKNVLARTGKMPLSMPPKGYMPILGGIIGAAAGLFPAEYKAKTKMQKDVGLEPMTITEFKKRDVYPTLGAVTLGLLAAGATDKAIGVASTNKLTSDVKWYKNYPAISSAGIGLATEVAAEQHLSKILNKEMEKTMDKKASAKELLDKIAEEAMEYGFAMEMEAIRKEHEKTAKMLTQEEIDEISRLNLKTGPKIDTDRAIRGLAGVFQGGMLGGAMGMLIAKAMGTSVTSGGFTGAGIGGTAIGILGASQNK